MGKRGITADTALRLLRLLKTSPQFWMRLQADWDLHRAVTRAARIASELPFNLIVRVTSRSSGKRADGTGTAERLTKPDPGTNHVPNA